ncbi:hypothetical protein COP2_017797 [Malus domestica]
MQQLQVATASQPGWTREHAHLRTDKTSRPCTIYISPFLHFVKNQTESRRLRGKRLDRIRLQKEKRGIAYAFCGSSADDPRASSTGSRGSEATPLEGWNEWGRRWEELIGFKWRVCFAIMLRKYI